jgi:hypothetical protein
MMKDWQDFLIWWAVSLLAAAMMAGGKLGMMLFRLANDPPADPVLAEHWKRRRRWLTYAEFSALPAFATISVAITAQQQLDPIFSVLISMALGGIGLTLLIDGLVWKFRKRLGLPDELPPALRNGENSHG